jgi:hypothetical protein
MVKKFTGLRADPAVLKRLKALAVEAEAPMGDTLKRLLDLADAATPMQRMNFLLNDADAAGEIVPEGESEAAYVARKTAERRAAMDADDEK